MFSEFVIHLLWNLIKQEKLSITALEFTPWLDLCISLILIDWLLVFSFTNKGWETEAVSVNVYCKQQLLGLNIECLSLFILEETIFLAIISPMVLEGTATHKPLPQWTSHTLWSHICLPHMISQALPGSWKKFWESPWHHRTSYLPSLPRININSFFSYSWYFLNFKNAVVLSEQRKWGPYTQWNILLYTRNGIPSFRSKWVLLDNFIESQTWRGKYWMTTEPTWFSRGRME